MIGEVGVVIPSMQSSPFFFDSDSNNLRLSLTTPCQTSLPTSSYLAVLSNVASALIRPFMVHGVFAAGWPPSA